MQSLLRLYITYDLKIIKIKKENRDKTTKISLLQSELIICDNYEP